MSRRACSPSIKEKRRDKNAAKYALHSGGSKQRRKVHVVVCNESWGRIDNETCEKLMQTSRHAWLSSKPLHRGNVHERCNIGALHRWAIESGFIVEKRHGYN